MEPLPPTPADPPARRPDAGLDSAFSADLTVPWLPALLNLLGVASLLVWILGLLFPSRTLDREGQPPDSWADLESRVLEAVTEAEPRSILLLGDSVLAGTLLNADDPSRSGRYRVAARMRAQLAADAGVGLHDLSWPGALPADLVEVRRLLDRHDPSGRVELVVELTPRYFSSAYARDPSRHSLEFLTEGPPLWARWPGHTVWSRLTAGLRRGRGGLQGLRRTLLDAATLRAPDFFGAADGDSSPGNERNRALYRLRILA